MINLANMKKTLFIVFFIVICGSISSQNITNFTLTDTKGKTHDLYSYLSQKRAVVLDFFLATCGNCATFVPMLEQLYQDYGLNTEWVVVLSMECSDTALSAVEDWKTVNGGTYPSIGGPQAKSYWESNWKPILGGAFNQVITLIPHPSGQPQNALIDYMNIGMVDPSDMTQLRYSLTNNGFHQGILNNDQERNIHIYPNPSKGILNIKTNFEDLQQIIIRNALGQTIKEFSTAGITKEAFQIDLSEFGNGLYFVEVKGNDDVFQTKIILQ
jgi:thiol-disulfide isomerase/thioredoxin